MKLKFKFKLKFYIASSLALVFLALCYFDVLPMSGVGVVCAALTVIYLAALEINFYSPVAVSIVMPLVGILFSLVTGQLLVDRGFSGMNTLTVLCNIFLIGIFYYVFLLVLGRVKPAATLGAVAFFILHFINYVVWLFRGREMAVSDFYSAKNAAGVVDSYVLTLSTNSRICLIALAVLLFLFLSAKYPKAPSRVRLTALGCAALCCVGLLFGMKHSKNSFQNLGTNSTLFNGATYKFIVELRESRVTPPEGYSHDRAEEILAEYEMGKSEADTPHIIVIMNEAFSDLSVLGELETNTDPIPYFNSLSANTVRGWALSSVLGGNTATSEWEFLTGNTSAFLPYGSIAYQQYIKDHAWSIVDTLTSNGYTAVAMHPYTRSFWMRDRAYEIMGFDEMYFIDELTTSDKMRGFVTDRAFFGDIINRFEEKEKNEKLFMFNITMQNHGGYKWGGFEHTVTTGREDWYEVDQYLTMTNHTDKALKDFLEYFEGVDERVMVVMFGDHQPSLPQSFYKELFGTADITFAEVQKKQTVPFIIWTNYETEAEDGVVVGLNALSGIMLERAGISLPPYLAFLADMREDIPALNAYGYYSETLGRYARNNEAQGIEAEWLEKYRVVQYNNLFGGKHRSDAFDYETDR